MQGAGIEQGGCGRNESEGREYFVKLNGARFFVFFIPGEAHGYAHPEELRGFNAALVDVEQIAIKYRLYAQVLKVFIALGF